MNGISLTDRPGGRPANADALPTRVIGPLLAPLRAAIERATTRLFGEQRPDGHWVGELQGDTILESEFVILLVFMGRDDDPRIPRAARYLLDQQTPSGGWNNYPGGPDDLSVSVKGYFALKLAGFAADHPALVRARAAVLRLGGAEGCNSFTKFYLALLGQIPYGSCASVPPELTLLPRWFYVNLYAMSSWTRTIVVPLSLVSAFKPVRELPAARGIRELFLSDPARPRWPQPPSRGWFTWKNVFLLADQAYKWFERREPVWLRRLAVREAAAWMVTHFEDSDGVGAIFPPIIYTIIALRCLGYADDAPKMRWAMKQLDDLVIDDGGGSLRVQPCFSPVWDTALSLIGLADAGADGRQQAVARGVRWLLGKEVRRPGDWCLTSPGAAPGGWFFEYRNAFYPDTDDTAMVLMALARVGYAFEGEAALGEGGRLGSPPPSPFAVPPCRRGLLWLLSMQNRDGGWAAFDRDINRQLLTKVPFADHNAMLDPSCPDITGRVLEALGHYNFGCDHRQVRRALRFIARTQEPFGGWVGRWGVNYLYGTWQVLAGLAAIHFDQADPMVRRAVGWLKQAQQPGGGWGETCRSYDDPSLAGRGTPTASQTAWALLGLMAAGEWESDAVRAGIAYLVSTQDADGNWTEEPFTGTGFPKVFYLKYHLYSLYFPLMALARFARRQAEKRAALDRVP